MLAAKPKPVASYKISRRADDDLVRIYLVGAEEFGEAQAERYSDRLYEAFAFLADNPHATRERSELRNRSRALPCGSHLVIYRIEGKNIDIQRIRHMREDWGR